MYNNISLPLVTIIAVCYNQENWVEETLNSILYQTYPNIQLIIADDGSTDRSKEIIKDWIDKNNSNATFINHKTNLGLTKNINSTLKYVKGDFFQVFGCDDIMLPNKIEQQVAFFEANSQFSIIYTEMDLIGRNGESLSKTYFEKHSYKKPLSGYIYKDLINRFIISAPSVLIKREVLNELKSYNKALDYEDHDFFLRAAKLFEFKYLPQVTVRYRITNESLSTRQDELKFFKNSFLIYFQRFDKNPEYRSFFLQKLLFYTKNLYSKKYKNCFVFFLKAFLKTGSSEFLKYSFGSIPFIFKQ